MRYRPFFTLTAALSALALPLLNCGTSPGRLNVDLAALKECQRLDPKVEVKYIDDDADYRDITPQALAALKKKNEGADARTRCENIVIAKYAAANAAANKR